ncbi:hypothetical protein AWN90_07740 [Nocardia terpenica]|uniref:Uncharacterized protein n=1 Tax=Nocardia terpenica TaxID=455432 RepID=A0A161X997_9NOCA|nr:hypothetical protein AWN90_07740 [Nocardia terpenica]
MSVISPTKRWVAFWIASAVAPSHPWLIAFWTFAFKPKLLNMTASATFPHASAELCIEPGCISLTACTMS